MHFQPISRSIALSNIPQRKLQEKILALVQSCKDCSQKNIKTIEQAFDGLCERCSILVVAYNRYFEANIPISYWELEMKDFKGSPDLKKAYDNLIIDIPSVYKNGDTICLSGLHGVGKTYATTAFLKKCCQKNYNCLYSTLNDIVSALIDPSNEEKFLARRELMTVDFLAIDELDPRFINGENASDLFGKMLEHIYRTRLQNKLPTIICTNSPNPVEAFSGAFKQSIDSLMSKVNFVYAMGKDFRKQK